MNYHHIVAITMMSGMLQLNWIFRPLSVSKVWSVAGLGVSVASSPLVLIQVKSAVGSDDRPHSEPWKVHSRSAGQDPFILFDTCTSSMAMQPLVPSRMPSKIIYWMQCMRTNMYAYIHLGIVCMIQYLNWFFTVCETKVHKTPLVALSPCPHPHKRHISISMLGDESERAFNSHGHPGLL